MNGDVLISIYMLTTNLQSLGTYETRNRNRNRNAGESILFCSLVYMHPCWLAGITVQIVLLISEMLCT